MNRILRHLVLAFFLPLHFWAQETAKYAGENASFFRAEELYEKAQYSAAKQEFRAFINGSKEAKRNPNDPFMVKAYYYEGISALELYNNDAIPLLDAFNKAYPDNIYKNKIALKIGNFHFQNEDFESAQLAYSKVPVREVESDEKEEVLFKMGYSAFQNGDLESSYDAFRDVKDGSTQYAKPSLYFYSHISYTKNALQVALEGFQKLRTDSTFCGVVPYYIAQILHKQGKFQEVIDLAPTVLSCSVVNNEADIQHIIGDAYYQLAKYTEAIAYLEKYHAKSKGSRDDFYELGFSYYKTNQFEKAIKNFDWNKDLRFISYAVWWIKQSVIQSLNDNSRTIRLPVNVVQDLHKAKKEVEQTGKKLDDKFTSLPSIIDLDMNINEDGDTLVDVIKNEGADMPDEAFNGKDLLKAKLISLLILFLTL